MDNYTAANQMVDFENSDQPTNSYQDADVEVENERMETYFLPVGTLTDVDTLAITGENIPENLVSIWHQPQVKVPQKVRPVKPRVLTDGTPHTRSKIIWCSDCGRQNCQRSGSYDRYQHQNSSILHQEYNDDEERRLPVSVRKLGAGRKARLTEAHSQFLIEYVNQYPAAVLSDIRQNLCEAFPGSSISISALHRRLVRKCKLTLKKLEKITCCKE